MSRSLGDKVAHSAGVSSEPEIFEVRPYACASRWRPLILPLRQLQLVEGEHLFLVSASDGLWEFMTSQEVVDIAAKFRSTEDAVNELVKEAKTRWLREEEVIDDTTVVIACIGAWRGGGGAAAP
jgi:serine/threonine protein phosphatase PrpC